MAEVMREEQHLVKYSLQLDEAEIRRVLGQYVADKARVNLNRPGVTCQVLVREVGAQGVTGVEVKADVLICIDELEARLPLAVVEEVVHG